MLILGTKVPQSLFFQLNTCYHSPHETSSLTRGQVCRLQLLLDLASAVIVVSDCSRTCNHILLSQIQVFLFVAFHDSKGYGGGIRLRLHTESLQITL
jgi:hypothetical protein